MDARAKLALLLVYSICLFVACTWRSLGLLALLLAAALVSSRLPASILSRTMVPLYFIMMCAIFFNSLGFSPVADGSAYGIGGVSAGVSEHASPIHLAGGLYFLPAGLVRSLFYCIRVTALVLASLLAAYSTPSTQLTAAFAWALRPLRRVGVPVDDIAFTFTLALRFIPLAFEELQQTKTAQMARGAAFGTGGLWRRMRAWLPVMVPWLTGLYRRAERVATAMDVRAYGLATGMARSALNPLRARFGDIAALAIGAAACVLACAVPA